MSGQPVRFEEFSSIQLPQDQYAHPGAPTEWWWHIGTLVCSSKGEERTFGFEINATSLSVGGFTQIEITDVATQINYQKVTPVLVPPDYAESNPEKPWYVKLGGSTKTHADGAVSMQAIDNNPLAMAVEATFQDVATSTQCKLSLQLWQEEKLAGVPAPLLVWGTGCREVDPKGKTPLTKNNYYYSLTRLRAEGTIQIGSDNFQVEGITWMDHEYGAFAKSNAIWTLQDMQLSNGIQLSNYTKFDVQPEENIPMESCVTVLLANGLSVFLESKTTPRGPIFKSKKGVVYFMEFKVDIDTPELTASFLVKSLMHDQLFVDPGSSPDVYEGVAKCEGLYGNSPVSGTAWIEQSLG